MLKINTPLTQVDTFERFTLGSTTKTKDGNEYIYLKGVSAGSAYKLVSYDEDYATTLAINTTAASCIGPLASLMATIDSTSKYGWAIIKGEGKSLGSVTTDTRLQPGTTAGIVQVSTGSSYATVGLWSRSASATAEGQATTQFDYPVVIAVNLS